MRGADRKRRVVHQADSALGTIFVVDRGDERMLCFGSPHGNRQSAMLKSNPLAVPLSYVRVATAGLAFTSGRSRALVLGLGGGSFPMLLCRCLPRMVVDVVEVNPVVVDVARRFFGVRESERLRIHLEDGARFMQRQGARYDLILLDAFSGEGIPEQFKEPAFFEAVLGRLAPGGAVVLNIAMETEESRARLQEMFTHVFEHCARLYGRAESSNTILVGTQEPLPAEPLFRQQLWRLAREMGFPALPPSVVGYEAARPE
jgi:spermidine synthase